MSVGAVTQLLAFNIAVLLTSLGLGAVAKPDDRVVYVVSLPWLPLTQVEKRIDKSGARRKGASWLPFVVEVVVPNRQVFARLAEDLPALMFTAASSSICSSEKVSTR